MIWVIEKTTPYLELAPLYRIRLNCFFSAESYHFS